VIVENCGAVVDVFHVGRLDEGVVQVLARGIQRMVDLERPSGLDEMAGQAEVLAQCSGIHDATTRVLSSKCPITR
jgi:hypothetical protein